MKRIFTVAAAILLFFQSFSQERLAVTYEKTVHIIFKSRIMYVDLGSESIMASIIENIPNILRIKAAEKNFNGETNLSVILEDNTLHNFNVYYSDTITEVAIYPDDNIDCKKRDYCLDIYNTDKQRITTISSEKHGITAVIKSIYLSGEKVYINLEIRNSTSIPFQIDNVSFEIADKKGKFSGEELRATSSYFPQDYAEAKKSCHMVYEFDRFPLASSNLLIISVSEKSGSRHVNIKIDGKLFTRSLERL